MEYLYFLHKQYGHYQDSIMVFVEAVPQENAEPAPLNPTFLGEG